MLWQKQKENLGRKGDGWIVSDGPVRRTEGGEDIKAGEEVGSEGGNRQSPAAGHFPGVRH